MKFSYLLSIVLLSMFFSGAVIAQEQKKEVEKKATIVIKTIDADGNETIEKLKLEGAELDAHLNLINADNNQKKEVELIETRNFTYAPGKKVENIPFLGVMMNMLVDQDDHGGGDIIITKIITVEPVPNSPAEKAGIKKGDVLFSLDEIVIEDIATVTNYIKGKKIGDIVVAKIVRDGETISLPIELAERPGIMPDAEEKSYRKPHGKHHSKQRIKRDPCKPFIGVSTNGHRTSEIGLEILSVIDHTPAKKEGLQPGDLILEMDRQKINSQKELVAIRDRHESGDRFQLLIQRNGKKIRVRSSFNDCPKDTESVEKAIEIDQEVPQKNVNIDLNIFPNPTVGEFTISYNGQPGILKIFITDISGKLFFEKITDNFEGNFNEQINLKDISEGTVIVQIENEGEIVVEKLILQSPY